MWLITGILCIWMGNYPEIGLNNYKKELHTVSETEVFEYEVYEGKNRKSDHAWKFEIRTINQDDTRHKCKDNRERLSHYQAEYLQKKYPVGKNVTVYYQGGYSGPCLILNTSGLKVAAIVGIVLLSLPLALVGVVIALLLLCGIMVCVLYLVQAVFCCHNKDTEAKTVELPIKCGTNAV